MSGPYLCLADLGAAGGEQRADVEAQVAETADFFRVEVDVCDEAHEEVEHAEDCSAQATDFVGGFEFEAEDGSLLGDEARDHVGGGVWSEVQSSLLQAVVEQRAAASAGQEACSLGGDLG